MFMHTYIHTLSLPVQICTRFILLHCVYVVVVAITFTDFSARFVNATYFYVFYSQLTAQAYFLVGEKYIKAANWLEKKQ